MNRLFRISRLGLMTVATFLLLLLCFRLLLPFGDEPDFTVRAVELTEGDWPVWTIYSWVPGLLGALETASVCKIEAGAFAVVAHVDHASCTQDLSQVILRFVLTLLVTFPIILFIVWRDLGMTLLGKVVHLSPSEMEARFDAFALSLLVPGFIYYISVLSPEQLTLAISLFVFMFWGNWIAVFILVVLVASIDMGNAVVIACFLFVYWLTTISTKRLGVKVAVFLGALLLVLVGAIGDQLLPLFGEIPLLKEKVDALIDADSMGELDLRDKYPIALRPLITFMTFLLATPAGIKIIPIYILVFLALMLGALHLRRRCKLANAQKKEANSYWLTAGASAVFTIIFLIFMLPGYANGKYYAFLLPFMIRAVLEVFSPLAIFSFLALCSSLVPVALILFRL